MELCLKETGSQCQPPAQVEVHAANGTRNQCRLHAHCVGYAPLALESERSKCKWKTRATPAGIAVKLDNESEGFQARAQTLTAKD